MIEKIYIMEDIELLRKTKKIFSENLYATIATSSKSGNTWISNIYFALDKNYNLYWYSSKESNHSQLIKENPSIAISIFNSTLVGDDVDAIYIKAHAYEVKDNIEILKGLVTYGKKLLITNFIQKNDYVDFIKKIEDFKNKSPLRLYKAIPEKIWKLSQSEIFNGKYVDKKVEVKLNI